MSTEHVYTHIAMPDLTLVKDATDKCGCNLHEGQTTYKSYFGNQKCDHAISVRNNDGAFEAGLVWQDASTANHQVAGYRPRFDPEGNGGHQLQKAIGQGGSKLLEAYIEAGAERFAAEEGYYVESRQVEEATGDILMELVCQA